MNDEIKNEIQSLIDFLKTSHPDAESTESAAIEYLTCALKNCKAPDNLNADMDRLKRFWMESIPWCSELSKQIERIIILYDELKDQANNG